MFEINEIKDIINNYYDYRENRISLIATENVTSKLQKSCYLVGLSEQYGSRLPENAMNVDNLSFGNIGAIDKINYITRETVKELFHVPECDVRLLSGVNGLTVLLFSLLNHGDVLFKMSDSCGGHLSVRPIAEKVGAEVVELYYNDDISLDLDDFKKKYEIYKPKVIFLDSSYMLFKYPVRQIKEIVQDNAIIVYDASHVIPLIATGNFQNPFLEGADIIHATMHKMMWGPQKAILLFKEKNELTEKMMSLIGNVLVSNTHLHHVLALLVSLIELKEFGHDYVRTLIKNNKFFAKCLSKRGFDIMASEHGYTETNQFWVRFENKEKAIEAFKILENINISSNIIFLPNNEWGLRIGTNEITRLGVEESFFESLSELFERAIIKKEAHDKMKKESVRLANELKKNGIQYTFDNKQEGLELMKRIFNQFRDI